MKTCKQHNIPYIIYMVYWGYFHVCLKIFKIVMKLRDNYESLYICGIYKTFTRVRF